MERHRCKVCFRNFGDGRALGGHMRSHSMNSSKQVEETHSCSSSRGEVVENREDGETAPSSKIRAREITNYEERSPLSSVSDTATEEDVARCLMMLSRDRWERRNENDDDDDDDEEDSGHLRKAKGLRWIRGKYKCEKCNKLFKSYQALGGHRASYNKKIKTDVAARFSSGPAAAAAAAAAVEEKVHECPFCDRVFASGQALGGHKRSHFRGASSVRIISRIGENLDIDLNLPAPVDDGEQ
ncbi:LOW QUALITY PROTEIN: zinc finger protein ZAT9-like [Salvia miltiorrhiza]|uniref:LOW QUALITY PROTEIN: zinc finger protein ZAT9-like n=1 Tax=Salvia miltiorrhiza TaxID=226208 RepID=UPI0025ABD714|nr:LOW QUALITY PROTEIN: zinc finger protein ZAT9-like [Salvia miltiorrhiza]